jgi:hypothetical protein
MASSDNWNLLDHFHLLSGLIHGWKGLGFNDSLVIQIECTTEWLPFHHLPWASKGPHSLWWILTESAILVCQVYVSWLTLTSISQSVVYASLSVAVCFRSICIPNFTCLAVVIHFLLPSNRKLNTGIIETSFVVVHSTKYYPNKSLIFFEGLLSCVISGLLLKWCYYHLHFTDVFAMLLLIPVN